MAADSSVTLLRTMEWAKKFNFNRRSGLGTYLEPAITNANLIMQTIMGAPFAWRWNRVTTGFITIAGQQDYYIFNWKALTMVQLGWVLVDPNGFSQRVTTASTTGSVQPSWNNVVGGTTFDGGIVWQNTGAIGTSTSSTYSLGWIENVAVKDVVNGTPTKWYEMSSQICLGLGSDQTRPAFISAQGDDGTGNITFRMLPIPDKQYPVAITLQQKPTLFSPTGLQGLNQTWSPIPDEYAHIYNWGFLALFWLFSDDPRFQFANAKFVTSLLSANDGLDETQKNIFLGNWSYVTGQPMIKTIKNQQGSQARGT